MCWFSSRHGAHGVSFVCLYACMCVCVYPLPILKAAKSQQTLKGGHRVVLQGGYVFGKETLYPAATPCIPLHQLSTTYTALSCDACSKLTHSYIYTHTQTQTSTYTITHRQTELPGWVRGVSSTTSSVILHRRKSFRFLSCLADRWLHMVTAKWKVRGRVFFLFRFNKLKAIKGYTKCA